MIHDLSDQSTMTRTRTRTFDRSFFFRLTGLRAREIKILYIHTGNALSSISARAPPSHRPTVHRPPSTVPGHWSSWPSSVRPQASTSAPGRFALGVTELKNTPSSVRNGMCMIIFIPRPRMHHYVCRMSLRRATAIAVRV